MQREKKKIFFPTMLISFMLTGCGDVKKIMGIDKSPPQELYVNPMQKGLEIPPDFDVLPQKSLEKKSALKKTVRQSPKTPSLTEAEKEVLKTLSPSESSH